MILKHWILCYWIMKLLFSAACNEWLAEGQWYCLLNIMLSEDTGRVRVINWSRHFGLEHVCPGRGLYILRRFYVFLPTRLSDKNCNTDYKKPGFYALGIRCLSPMGSVGSWINCTKIIEVLQFVLLPNHQASLQDCGIVIKYVCSSLNKVHW